MLKLYFFRFNSEFYQGLLLEGQPANSTCSLSALFRTKAIQQRKAALQKKYNPRRAADQAGLQQMLNVGSVFTGETTGHYYINSGITGNTGSWKMRFYQADQSQSGRGADSTQKLKSSFIPPSSPTPPL